MTCSNRSFWDLKPYIEGTATDYPAPGSNRSFWDLKPSSRVTPRIVSLQFKPFLLGFETKQRRAARVWAANVQTVPSGI